MFALTKDIETIAAKLVGMCDFNISQSIRTDQVHQKRSKTLTIGQKNER